MVTAVENEYKFTTDDYDNMKSALERLETYLIQNDIVYSYKVKKSVDSYFDTEDLVLFNTDRTLRRKVSSNGKIKLTFKEPISNEFGMMSREETERASDGTFGDLCKFVRKKMPDVEIEKTPVFTLKCERYSYDLDNGTNLAFDHCTYVYGDEKKDFLEIELEFMSESVERDFDSDGLCDLALELGFQPTVKSKYQRGVEWVKGL